MSDSYSDARAPIYLIESPSPEDLYRGRNEGHSLVSILALGEIEVNYFLASDAERFKCALHDISVLINKRSDKDESLPFIHISAHASEDGIELTDGDCIYWEDLTFLLEKLHKAVSSHLNNEDYAEFPRCSLSLSSCSAFINFTMSIEDNMPVQAILGPMEDVGWCQSLLAFSSFYYQAFVGRQSFQKAVSAMNAATCINGTSVFALRVTERLQLLAKQPFSTIVALRFPIDDMPDDDAVVKPNVTTLPDPGRHAR